MIITATRYIVCFVRSFPKQYFHLYFSGCWITEKYLGEGIGLEYAWMWLAATLNLAYYLAAFLVLKGYLFVERTLNGRYNVYVYMTSRKTREELRNYYGSPVSPYRLLW